MKKASFMIFLYHMYEKANTRVSVRYRRMAEMEFCRHILSCRELKAESFKKYLNSVLRGVSL